MFDLIRSRYWLLFALLFSLAVAAPTWAESETEEGDDGKDDASAEIDYDKIANAVTPSLVKVEYTLQYDKGQAPDQFGAASLVDSLDTLIREERPLEIAGYLIDGKTVITADTLIHPRFIKGIEVRFGDKTVEAEPAAWSLDNSVIYLSLKKPLPGAKPLKFDAKAEGPYYLTGYGQRNATWYIATAPMPKAVVRDEQGDKFIRLGGRGIIVTKDGQPVGMGMRGKFPIDESWKGSPDDWPKLTDKQMKVVTDKLREARKAALLPVTLRFRSPKQGSDRGMSDDVGTEMHTIGLITGPKQGLVIADLKPPSTARLEQVVFNVSEDKKLNAKFAHTLKDYGAIVVTLDEKANRPLAMSTQDIRDQVDKLLLTVQMRIQGESAEVYHNHARIMYLRYGWKKQLYPSLSGRDDLWVFDQQGRLVAFPVSRREKVTEEESWRSRRTLLTPAQYFAAILKNPQKHADKNNVPLSEEDENRLAWLGVEMQELDRELARANNVSKQTNDGQTGGMVNHIYPGSPADKLGLEQGMILLRLHVEGEPKPLDIEVDPLRMRSWPWMQYDRIPVQAFERAPTPWKSRDSTLTRKLTAIGVGKKVELEYFQDGEVKRKTFEVAWAPRHYEAAKRFKNEAVGVTVRNLTYDARHYFRRSSDDPGVIVSKVEPGSKADVVKIRPFEIITSVNGTDVKNIEEFEKAIQGQKELRLGVLRMTQNFVRKFEVDEAIGKDKDKDESKGDDEAKSDGSDAGDAPDATSDADDSKSENDDDDAENADDGDMDG